LEYTFSVVWPDPGPSSSTADTTASSRSTRCVPSCDADHVQDDRSAVGRHQFGDNGAFIDAFQRLIGVTPGGDDPGRIAGLELEQRGADADIGAPGGEREVGLLGEQPHERALAPTSSPHAVTVRASAGWATIARATASARGSWGSGQHNGTFAGAPTH
jgi:hypothetical protein